MGAVVDVVVVVNDDVVVVDDVVLIYDRITSNGNKAVHFMVVKRNVNIRVKCYFDAFWLYTNSVPLISISFLTI